MENFYTNHGMIKYLHNIVLRHDAEIQGIHKRMVQFQKLTRNLFLTLHGHNVHRQQRQLSKFRMRYQQLASHAYCGARSVITVQREFRAL